MGVVQVLADRKHWVTVIPLQDAQISATRTKGVAVPRERTDTTSVTNQITDFLLGSCVPDLNMSSLGTHGKIVTLLEIK